MTTSQYISWLIQRIAGNAFSRTQLLEAVDLAQQEILGRDIKFMRIKPDPYFRTTAGTYMYTASSNIYSGVDGTTQYDVRDIKRIYTYNVRNTANFAYGGWNRLSHRPDAFVNAFASDEVDIAFDAIPSIAPGSSDCRVALWSENDPGTQTADLRAVAYRWPNRLTSENVAMELPVQFQRGLLKYAVFKDLEYTEYGAADRPEELYDKEIAKFDSWASAIRGTAAVDTPPREV